MKRQHWILMLICLLAGGLVLPIAAYVVGGRVIGPFQGSRGLATYLGTLYADAAHGHVLALVTLLGPALCLVIWLLRAWLVRRTGQQEPAS
jgi:hypothetical protein